MKYSQEYRKELNGFTCRNEKANCVYSKYSAVIFGHLFHVISFALDYNQ